MPRKGRKQWEDFWAEWAQRMSEHISGAMDDWRESARESMHDTAPDPAQWQHFFQRFMGVPPGEHWLFGGRKFTPWRMGDWMFNPFVSTLLSKSGGLLPLYTLHLLSKAPHYGNEIITELAERTTGQGMVNPAAVYPLLSELEERGFVSGQWDDPVKRTTRQYTLTEAGHEELRRLKALMRPKLEEAIDVLKDMLDDLDEGQQEA